MKEHTPSISESIDHLYRTESRRILASLIRLLGDFDIAEEALHDAFAAALTQWPKDGIPTNPRAWLVSTGRFKAIDGIRRKARFESPPDDLVEKLPSDERDPVEHLDEGVEDDQLRLIFTCCHPALAQEARIALTLREVCGLTTEEIARAFLTTPPTVAQRIVRAKAKIRSARIPYVVPAPSDLPDRIEGVLQVIYLVFNEGYSASFGDSLTRADLSGEAIRLGRLLLDLLPDPEVQGLLALMLFQESRRKARTSPSGDIVLLEDQDRSLWVKEYIIEGKELVGRVFSNRQADGQGVRLGSYSIQAAIAGAHAEAAKASETNWDRIVRLYDMLMLVEPSPVVDLNRAVAVAMREGPQAGLTIIDALLKKGDLEDYHLAHSARAELCRRLGKKAEARVSYERALQLVKQEPERRFLEGKLRELTN